MKKTLIVIMILSQTGCSSIIYLTGKHSKIVEEGKVISVSREEVRQELGDPERIKIESGSECDVFIVKGMIPDNSAAEFCLSVNTETLFLTEFYFFPKSLYDLYRRKNKTHEITTRYSEDGYLIETEIKTFSRHNQVIEPAAKTPGE